MYFMMMSSPADITTFSVRKSDGVHYFDRGGSEKHKGQAEMNLTGLIAEFMW